MNKSEILFERAKKVIPGGVHSPVRSFKGLHTTPRFIKSAQGAYLEDVDGNNYIDFCMSFGPLIFGHRDPEIESCMKSALEKGWTFGACEPYSLALAEFITNKIPFIDQVRFVNSGTEAVMTATRIVRGATGKNKIIKFNGCYHGHMDALLVKSGSGLAGEANSSSLGVGSDTVKSTLVAELDSIESVQKIFDLHKNEIAAVAIEPLPANYGLLPQRLEFLKELKALCRKENALLLFDEVISGFRMAFGGMAELINIEPDIVTYGKVIGAGMPVGAVGAKKELMELLAPIGGVYQAGTLSGNPVAMQAGLLALQKISAPDFYTTLNDTALKVVQLLNHWTLTFDHGRFSHYHWEVQGSLFWPVRKNSAIAVIRSLHDLPITLASDFFDLFAVLLSKGIYLAPNAYEVGFVSTAHAQALEDLKHRLWS